MGNIYTIKSRFFWKSDFSWFPGFLGRGLRISLLPVPPFLWMGYDWNYLCILLFPPPYLSAYSPRVLLLEGAVKLRCWPPHLQGGRRPVWFADVFKLLLSCGRLKNTLCDSQNWTSSHLKGWYRSSLGAPWVAGPARIDDMDAQIPNTKRKCKSTLPERSVGVLERIVRLLPG